MYIDECKSPIQLLFIGNRAHQIQGFTIDCGKFENSEEKNDKRANEIRGFLIEHSQVHANNNHLNFRRSRKKSEQRGQ